jgi:hypothetical protein
MRSVGALAVVGLGCAPVVKLPDVPIEGGTAEQQAEARAELLDFDQWIGPGRVRIASLTFERVEGPHVATYKRPQRSVVVESSTPLHEVRQVVRHELCHALDFAEDLVRDPSDLFDHLGGQVEARLQEGVDLSDRGLRGEAFALVCEQAPLTMHLLAEPCSHEDPLASSAATWLVDRVWTSFRPPLAAPLGTPVPFTGGASVEGQSWTDVTVRSTSDPALVYVTLFDGEWPVARHADRETGEVVDSNADPIFLLSADDLYVAEPPLSGFFLPLGSVEGPTIGFLKFDIEGIDMVQDRILWRDSDTGDWAPIGSGCVPEPGEELDVFIGGDRAWTSWLEDNQVYWAPIEG